MRPCRTSQQQGRRNVLTPGGELGRAMPWYRSGVLCNSQTSRRPVGDDGDFHIIPRSWRVLVGYNCGNRRSRRWNPYLSAIPSVSASGALRFDRRIRLEFRGARRLRPWDCAARQGRNPPCRSRQDALRLQLERRSHNALGLPAGAGWRLDHAAWNTDRPTRAQRIGVVDAVAASQRGSDQRQHLVPSVRPSGAPPRSR